MSEKPTVLVAGFFDTLHSEHIRFLEEEAQPERPLIFSGSNANDIANKRKHWSGDTKIITKIVHQNICK